MAKKKAKSSNEQVYFVGVSNPLEVRRSMLESSRELIQFLQMYEKFKVVRNEKREAVALLKAEMKDLNGMIAKLKKVLPETSLRMLQRHEQNHHRIEMPKAPKQDSKKEVPEEPELASPPQPKPELSEIEKLEQELAAIEGKLNTL